MNTKDTLYKMTFRWLFVSAVAIALFWTFWYLIKGSVPVVSEIRITKDIVYHVPVALSRWWDILIVPAWSSMLIWLLLSNGNRGNNTSDGFILTVFVVGIVTGLIAGLFVGFTTGFDIEVGVGLGAALVAVFAAELIAGLGAVLSASLIAGLVAGLGASLIAGIGAVLSASLVAGLRYFIIRLCLFQDEVPNVQ